MWNIVAGVAVHLGGTAPDINELFRNNAELVGQPGYGIPRWVPETYGEPPRDYLPLWERYLPDVRKRVRDLQGWPVVYAAAIAKLFEKLRGEFDLGDQARVVMEAAIAMAKLKS